MPTISRAKGISNTRFETENVTILANNFDSGIIRYDFEYFIRVLNYFGFSEFFFYVAEYPVGWQKAVASHRVNDFDFFDMMWGIRIQPQTDHSNDS